MRSLRRLGVFVAAVALVGCYTLQPTGGTAPPPGNVIGLDLNDAGRAALGGAMGPEIGQVEGRLIEKNDTSYVVGVLALHLLRGGEQVWRGEAVQVKKEYVTGVYERRFSASRSAALAAAGVGAVAILAGKSILGGGQEAKPITPPESGQATRRRRP